MAVARRSWGQRARGGVGSSVGIYNERPAGVEVPANVGAQNLNRTDREPQPGLGTRPGDASGSGRNDVSSSEGGVFQEMRELVIQQTGPTHQEGDRQLGHSEAEELDNRGSDLCHQPRPGAQRLPLSSLVSSQPNSPGSSDPSKEESYRTPGSTAGRTCCPPCLSPCVSAALDVRAPCSFTFWVYDDGPEETLARGGELEKTGGSPERADKVPTTRDVRLGNGSTSAPPAEVSQPVPASPQSFNPSVPLFSIEDGRESREQEVGRIPEYARGQRTAGSSTPAPEAQVRINVLCQRTFC